MTSDSGGIHYIPQDSRVRPGRRRLGCCAGLSGERGSCVRAERKLPIRDFRIEGISVMMDKEASPSMLGRIVFCAYQAFFHFIFGAVILWKPCSVGWCLRHSGW